MKRAAIITVFMALCATHSCAPARIIKEIQKDSVIIEIRDSIFLRDTVIQVEIPEESDKAVLQDSDTSHLQTSLAESEAFVKDGRLHHTLRNRSEKLQPVRVQYRDRVRSEKTEAIGLHRAVETVEVERPVNPWQRFRMTLGDLLLTAAAAWAAWKLAKMFGPL